MRISCLYLSWNHQRHWQYTAISSQKLPSPIQSKTWPVSSGKDAEGLVRDPPKQRASSKGWFCDGLQNFLPSPVLKGAAVGFLHYLMVEVAT